MSNVDQLLREGARQLGGVGDSPRLDAELLSGTRSASGAKSFVPVAVHQCPADIAEHYAALLAERQTRRTDSPDGRKRDSGPSRSH